MTYTVEFMWYTLYTIVKTSIISNGYARLYSIVYSIQSNFSSNINDLACMFKVMGEV